MSVAMDRMATAKGLASYMPVRPEDLSVLAGTSSDDGLQAIKPSNPKNKRPFRALCLVFMAAVVMRGRIFGRSAFFLSQGYTHGQNRIAHFRRLNRGYG